MARCLCGEEAVRQFISKAIDNDKENNRFALCKDHHEVFCSFLQKLVEEGNDNDRTYQPPT